MKKGLQKLFDFVRNFRLSVRAEGFSTEVEVDAPGIHIAHNASFTDKDGKLELLPPENSLEVTGSGVEGSHQGTLISPLGTVTGGFEIKIENPITASTAPPLTETPPSVEEPTIPPDAIPWDQVEGQSKPED